MTLTCYCQFYCPDRNKFNGTCTVSDISYCYSSVELVYNDQTRKYEEFRTFGCLGENESGLMQCRSYLVDHFRPKNISCCRDTNECNLHLNPTIERYSFENDEFVINKHSPNLIATWLPILIGAVFFLLMAGFLASLLWKRVRERIKKLSFFQIYKSRSSYQMEDESRQTIMFDPSSGSGSGHPKLNQKTIGKDIVTIRCIGEGRYGEVYQGQWKDGSVAVKVFRTTDEKSWTREKEIYETVLLRHDNILDFIAADVRTRNSSTQLLLITTFHELGSLYDYLKISTLDKEIALGMAESTISGLNHLHTEIFGGNGKPAIAHRDIKSKNILVKRNRECCIADFGLAVKYSSESKELDLGCNTKVGTRRYLAPEVLASQMNLMRFESLKHADIYSYSLVLWEILRRCTGDGDEKNLLGAEEYQLPYYDCVPSAPSEEEMIECVFVKGIRPTVPERWKKDLMMKEMSNMLQECWNANPSVRLPSLRIKKNLRRLRDSIGQSTIRMV